MAITHALPGQVIDVLPQAAELAAQMSTALFKRNDLEVMRLVLQAGKSMPPHKVPGEITIHCIEGALSVSSEGVTSVVRAGQMLYLLGNVVHSLLAIEDASALVTIALVK